MKKIFCLIVILVLVFVGCRKESKLVNKNFLIELNEINPLDEGIDYFDSYFVNNERIYLVDRTLSKVYVYDFQGDLLGDFCSKGSGPGEVNQILNVVFLKGEIGVIDAKDSSISYFNHVYEFEGKSKYSFFKYPIYINQFNIHQVDSTLFGYLDYNYIKDGKNRVRKGLYILSDDFSVKEEIIRIADDAKDFYHYDFFNGNVYHNFNRDSFGYSFLDQFDKIKIVNFNLVSNTKSETLLGFNKIRRTKEEIKSIEEKYVNLRRKYKDITTGKIPIYKNSVNYFSLDNYGRVFVRTKTDDSEESKLLIVKDNKILREMVINNRSIGEMFFSNGRLIYLDSKDKNEQKIIVNKVNEM